MPFGYNLCLVDGIKKIKAECLTFYHIIDILLPIWTHTGYYYPVDMTASDLLLSRRFFVHAI